MQRIAQGMIETLRMKYVTAQPPISLRDLAAEAKIGVTTIFRYAKDGDWAGQRDAYWVQAVAVATDKATQVAAGAAATSVVDQMDVARSLRWWAVTLDDMAAALAKGVEDRVEEIEPIDRAKLIAQLASARVTVQRSLELVEGRPTERHEVEGPPIILTAEQSRAIREAWDQVVLSSD